MAVFPSHAVRREQWQVVEKCVLLFLVVEISNLSRFATADELHAAPGPSSAFDCGMRQLALHYARKLQPSRQTRHFQQLADALNGAPRAQQNGCNVTLPGDWAKVQFAQSSAGNFPIPVETTTIFVDPKNGNDTNAGTESLPLRTLQRAVTLSRAVTERPVVIALRAGTFYLPESIQLDQSDSGLIIQSFEGEEVWLSGSVPIAPVWKAYNTTAGPVWVVESDQNAFYGRRPDQYIHINGTYSSWPECERACQVNGSCQVWTWIPPSYAGYRNECWFNEQSVWAPTPEKGIYSGYKQPKKNVYSADLSKYGIRSLPGLRINGQRAIRARFPNADPELGFGSDLRPTEWLKPTTPPHADRTIAGDTPFRNTSSSFQRFSIGIGGACNMYDPPSSYWCGPDNITRGYGQYMPRSPSGIIAGKNVLPNSPYANTTGAVVHAFAFGNHWFSWSFEVDQYDSDSGKFVFGRGGHQGPQGTDHGEQMYIENIFEELDSPNEWFFNETTQTLFLWFNGSGPPTEDVEFVAVQHKVLINVTGSQKTPVEGVQFKGVNFRDTAYAYLDPRAVPSDDWTLQYSAALVLQGTVNTTVDSCIFERVDGNAILILGFNRYATVQNSEFAWIGDTAIASWGFTTGVSGLHGVGWDGTDGNHPRHNQILGNIAREIGIWQKQSSFYFQAKSCLNDIKNNIAYNGPRAGVNFNDGFGGGSNLSENIILNMCRESGDHGPFNSWDKQVSGITFLLRVVEIH